MTFDKQHVCIDGLFWQMKLHAWMTSSRAHFNDFIARGNTGKFNKQVNITTFVIYTMLATQPVEIK